ncbi:hypothetical protein [Aliiroseovarius sp. 2305UL8-7]|uniref:hypothetical protein n=1 Tax=Aliiroseovarius conchicola TaxID=3121637 RepID=UPI00352735A9
MTYTLALPPRSRRPNRLQATLLGLVERHGRWRVVRAALFARPSSKLRPEDVSPALQRDLSLPAAPQELPSQRQHFL